MRPNQSSLPKKADTKGIIALGLSLCLIAGFVTPLQATSFDLGLRYDRHRSGHGLEIHRQGDTYVVFFYTYNEDATPDWYLCLGDMINGVLQGDCSRFQFVDAADPPLQVDPIAEGAFTLDFVAAGEAPACNDGKDRDDAEQLAVFGWSGVDEHLQWCTEFLRIGDAYPQPYYGGIWYGGDTDGYGCSMSHMDSTLSAICYYYDGAGQPRWVIGSGNIDAASIPLTHFQGYCRNCPVTGIVGTEVGSLALNLDPDTEPGSGFDRASLNLEFVTGPAGVFEREFPLLPLSDGSQSGEHRIPEVPIQSAAQVAAWRSDLDLFAEQLRSIHPNPFHGVSEVQFDAAMADLGNRLPYLRDDQFAAEVSKVAAMISRRGRDGHSNAIRFDSTALPLQFYLFTDGVYIVDALPPHQNLIGSRVTRIGTASIQTVLDRLDLLVSRDNEFSARWIMGTALLLTDALSGLGLVDDRSLIPLEVESTAGASVNAQVEPIPMLDYNQWKELGRNTLPAGEALYLSNLDQSYWFTTLPDSGTLYVQYNEVVSIDAAGQTMQLFSQRLANAVNDPAVQRMVIDLRHNNGGDNTTYGPLLDLLSTHQRIADPGFLYAIIGRQTFSAAMNFAADLDRFTTAVFVGEGTGGSPFHYGDSEPVVLPGLGIQVNISSRVHNSPFPDDDRLAILPDLPVELSSAQFFANIDPVLDAILSAD